VIFTHGTKGLQASIRKLLAVRKLRYTLNSLQSTCGLDLLVHLP
jgi:hypothetical protein